jgi:cytochrome c
MTIRSITTALGALAIFGATSGAAMAQDAAAGEKVFAKCKACHQIGEGAKNAVGPVLNGLMGRKTGSIEGYSYSDANRDSGLTWDEATFKEYIRNPKAKIPGTKMVFAGLQKDEDVDNIYAFIKQFDKDGKKAP